MKTENEQTNNNISLDDSLIHNNMTITTMMLNGKIITKIIHKFKIIKLINSVNGEN